MARFPSECPACSGSLDVTRLSCSACDMQIEGSFELPSLLTLPREDLEFVERFVRASGSLKEMAGIYHQSYPTIRNRLNDVIVRLEPRVDDAEKKRHEILDAISRGELSVREGAKRLEEVGR